MPDAITTASVQQYKANVELLMQQKESRLRKAVASDSYTGKAASIVDQFGETSAQDINTRHADTPLIDVPQARRWVHPRDRNWASLIDRQDKLRMLIDPTSPYAMEGAAAMNRKIDDVLLTAMFATAYVGEDGTGTEAFDTANYQVGVNVGGTASNLNVAKLQDALLKLMLANKGELDEQPYMAISSREHDSLLKEIQVNNSEYSGQYVLVDGKVRRFMGFEFIITERLSISGGNRLIPAWVPSGVHLGIWNDVTTKVSERADKNYAWQVYLEMTIGATRTQQGKVVQVLCDDLI